ncbi:hypothetical protein [Klebsiella pneumoniae]|uniref:hypothetical protein n=1 Tax=Klebsiella pneumoniae TaxID=573 RepID=UPI000D1B7049|nr:hypothetical protein [Klebsiella pneumoniae]
MIKLLLAALGPKLFTPKGRRLLILGSFYTLLSGRSGGCQRLACTMNRRLNLAQDSRGLLLGTILPEILWNDEQCEIIRKLPSEKVANYFEEMIPHWLKDGVEDSSFILRQELKQIVNLHTLSVSP